MIARDNIPVDAVTIAYTSGRRKGEYSIWKRQEHNADGDIDTVWFWSAVGDCGKAYDVDEAKQAAIRRIRDSK